MSGRGYRAFGRWTAHKDANHDAIRAALEARPELQVRDTHRANGGIPDLFVRRGERLWMLEIKSPGKRGDLTDEEREFQALFAPWYRVVCSIDEALAAVGVVR